MLFPFISVLDDCLKILLLEFVVSVVASDFFLFDEFIDGWRLFIVVLEVLKKRERERESGTRVLVEYILSCTIFEGEKNQNLGFCYDF